MIIRPSKKLSKKLKEPNLPALAPAANPFLDWHARLFTHQRAQYIMVSNSASLFSVLKNPAASCKESSIPMEKKHSYSRSLTPKQASRNALAVGFMHGAGVTDFTTFCERMIDTMKDVLHDIGADLIFQKIIVPGMREIRLAKSQDRRVIGAMNDNIHFAKFVLESEGKNLNHLSSRVNKYIHLFLKEGYPVDAFLGMKAGGECKT